MLIWNVSIARFFGMYCISFFYFVSTRKWQHTGMHFNVHWSFIFLLYALRVSLTARRGAGDPWEWLKSEMRGHAAAALHMYAVFPACNSLQVWGRVPVLFFLFLHFAPWAKWPKRFFKNINKITAWSSLWLWQHAATCHTLGEIVTKLQDGACWMPQP